MGSHCYGNWPLSVSLDAGNMERSLTKQTVRKKNMSKCE